MQSKRNITTRTRARAKRQRARERERETILIACRGWMDPYIIPRSNFSQLPLSLSFSLPRFSCVTLSGASSHFALVASHSVSLPNIVGVVFCTRIRIRSSSGTMKLTKGLYTRRKEGRKEREKKVESPPPPPLLFLCALFGRKKEGRR